MSRQQPALVVRALLPTVFGELANYPAGSSRFLPYDFAWTRALRALNPR